MEEFDCLQQILGTSHRNRTFSVHQNRDTNQYHVYYGMELYDVVPNDKEDTRFKLMVAHMHMVKVSLSALQEAFGLDPRTIKKWSSALRSGDADKLSKAMLGMGSNRKLTAAMEQFVRMRFEQIYPRDRYRYSSRIRKDIEKVFDESISGESLRKLFSELKAQFGNGGSSDEKNTSTSPDCQEQTEQGESNEGCEEPEDSASDSEGSTGQSAVPRVIAPNNRKKDAVFDGSSWSSSLGLLFFSEALCCLQNKLPHPVAFPVVQWLSQILLGAANLEQTKLLNITELEQLLGKDLLRCPQTQRNKLGELAHEADLGKSILRWNFERVGGHQQTELYFDPHTKHYTGKQNVLKGWCSSIRCADKIMNGDFVHTRKGQPVYLENTDNYDDIRKRFVGLEERYRSCFDIAEDKVLTWIIDRGIFSAEIFNWIAGSNNKHLITWEKGYKRDGWAAGASPDGTMLMERARNNSNDLRSYRFEWIESAWAKNPEIRRLVVRATNPKNRQIEVSILCDDWERDAQDIIWSMFDRWVQENDFKYLNAHFGINQITSYQSDSYSELAEEIEDRSMKNSVYLALERGRYEEKKYLGEILVKQKKAQRDMHKRREEIAALQIIEPLDDKQKKKLRALRAGQGSARKYIQLREIKINQSEERLDGFDEQLQHTLKEVSRLETLISKEMVRLRTDKKHFMDIIKITARNLFYEKLEPFKKAYDNYRDDHVWFRHLTQNTSGIIDAQKSVTCHLISHDTYPKSVRAVIQQIVASFNQSAQKMPDGSGRQIELVLAPKSAIKIAI